MKAIKINAEKQTVELIEWENLENLQKEIGGYIETVNVRNLTGHLLLVDEEGRFKDIIHFFSIVGVNSYIVGNALVVGVNESGDFKEPTCTTEDIEDIIGFISI